MNKEQPRTNKEIAELATAYIVWKLEKTPDKFTPSELLAIVQHFEERSKTE